MSRRARPLTDQDLRTLEVLFGYGLTEAAAAHVVGLSARQFRRRKRDDDRILAALEKGRAVAEAKVGKALYERAVRGDITATIWWEKTRAGRTDRQVSEHTGRDGKPLEVHVIYDDIAPGFVDELVEARAVPPRALPAPNGNGGSH